MPKRPDNLLFCGYVSADVHETRSFLVVETAGFRCAFLVRDVAEIMRSLPIHPIAGSPDFVAGTAILRGSPTPVVNLAALLGRGARMPNRLVSLRVGTRRVLLAVDSVHGVRELSRGASHPVPPLLSHAAGDALDALTELDGELLLVLRASRILPDGDTLEGPDA